jgi:hypothetical protein
VGRLNKKEGLLDMFKKYFFVSFFLFQNILFPMLPIEEIDTNHFNTIGRDVCLGILPILEFKEKWGQYDENFSFIDDELVFSIINEEAISAFLIKTEIKNLIVIIAKEWTLPLGPEKKLFLNILSFYTEKEIASFLDSLSIEEIRNIYRVMILFCNHIRSLFVNSVHYCESNKLFDYDFNWR